MKLTQTLKLVLVAHLVAPGLVSHRGFSILQVEAVQEKESKTETETGGWFSWFSRGSSSEKESSKKKPVDSASKLPATEPAKATETEGGGWWPTRRSWFSSGTDHKSDEPKNRQKTDGSTASAPAAKADQGSIFGRAKATVGGLLSRAQNFLRGGGGSVSHQKEEMATATSSRALVPVVDDLSTHEDWTCLPIEPLPSTRMRKKDWTRVNEGNYLKVGSRNKLTVDVVIAERDTGIIERPLLEFIRNTALPAAVNVGIASAAHVVVPAISVGALIGTAVFPFAPLAALATTAANTGLRNLVKTTGTRIAVKVGQKNLDKTLGSESGTYRKRIAVYNDGVPVHVIEADNSKMSQGRIGFFIFGNADEQVTRPAWEGSMVDHMHVLAHCEGENLKYQKARGAGGCTGVPVMLPVWYATKEVFTNLEVYSLYKITMREEEQKQEPEKERADEEVDIADIINAPKPQSERLIVKEIAATPSYILEGRTNGALVRYVSPDEDSGVVPVSSNGPEDDQAQKVLDETRRTLRQTSWLRTRLTKLLSDEANVVAVFQGRDFPEVGPMTDDKAGADAKSLPETKQGQEPVPGLLVKIKNFPQNTLEEHTKAAINLVTVWDKTNSRKKKSGQAGIVNFFRRVWAKMKPLPYTHSCRPEDEADLGLPKRDTVSAVDPAAGKALTELAEEVIDHETKTADASGGGSSTKLSLSSFLSTPTATASDDAVTPPVGNSFIVESDGDNIAETLSRDSTPPGLPEQDTTADPAVEAAGEQEGPVTNAAVLPRDVETTQPDFLERGATEQAEEDEKDLISANDVSEKRSGDPPLDASAPPPAPAAPPPVVVPSRPRSFLQRQTTAPVVVPPAEPVVVVPSRSRSFLQRRTPEPDGKNNPAGEENKPAGDGINYQCFAIVSLFPLPLALQLSPFITTYDENGCLLPPLSTSHCKSIFLSGVATWALLHARKKRSKKKTHIH
ncbi:unnamed protein product, partial [Amoebophrya sp. A120]|eukprot:GSA120T00022919001.1